MNKINQLFQSSSAPLLNVYFTAGYPGLKDTVPIIRSLTEAGVDLIEIGMPYSDPLADGPTIQESGARALANGMTLPLLFDQLAEARKISRVPFILMGYLNQVLQYGQQAFLEKCCEVGVDGLILPDLPLDVFETEFQELFRANNLASIFLITPQTPDERIRRIDQLSNGFVYVVSSASITGAKKGISEEQITYFERIRQLNLKNPTMIGFGISDHETFRTASRYADGAIIGSAFIRALGQEGALEQNIQTFIENIRHSNTINQTS